MSIFADVHLSLFKKSQKLEEATIRTDLLDSRSPRLAPFKFFTTR